MAELLKEENQEDKKEELISINIMLEINRITGLRKQYQNAHEAMKFLALVVSDGNLEESETRALVEAQRTLLLIKKKLSENLLKISESGASHG